ncbi:MAG: S9 family peptidase [Gemmatimonadales bacterium]
MRRLIIASLLCAGLVSPASAQEPYKKPPQVIVDILDAPPPPVAIVSPDRRWVLLGEVPSMPLIAELAEPMLRLAGARVNPRTNGPHLAQRLTGLLLKRVADGAERRIQVPANARLSYVTWSPDSRRIAFAHTGGTGIELWVADTTGGGRAVTPATLNTAGGAPCQWLSDAARLVCEFVPQGRGAPPAAAAVPVGPTIQETSGRAAVVRTFQDLLENAHDETLFDYYFTTQLVLVDAATGATTPLGAPAIFDRVDPAPSGEFLFVSRTVRPYSYLVPAGLFPKQLEVWNLKAEVVREIAKLPLAENIPVRGVRAGPRAVAWQPGAPATLVWAEALDGGDPRTKIAFQDHVVRLSAPFAGEPVELAKLSKRYAGVAWDGAGLALLSEYDRDRRWVKTWMLDTKAGAAPRVLWDRSAEDIYGDPGDPVFRSTPDGERVILRNGEWIYLAGAGASAQGERPFLDRLNLRTQQSERLWRADTVHYESVVAVLDDRATQVLTRRESRTEPPNYYVRSLPGGGVGRAGRLRALTAYTDPAPQLAGIEKRLVTYQREDGVPLSATLYLPPGYRPGTRLPVVMWAYPREFASAQAAGQVTASPNRFTLIRGPSHLFFLTQGYAVFDDPKMPILGGDTANNNYVEQLAQSARAAVKAVVALGVADRDRIGVGGHSYGAFMTANLLAHTDLFRAGIARSGAYNRTLTPTGFQSEERTYWEAPEVYTRMSPFMNADKINEPMLMTHGEADNNSGTFPIQSERMYHALKGLGKTTRLVLLPHEAHGYSARESVLHTLAEMVEWFDRYVKNAGARTAARE